MNDAALKVTATGAAALTGSTGVATVILDFFGNNAASIGAISTVVFGIIYVIFQYLSYRKLTKADDNQRQIDSLREQLNGLSERKKKRELTE